MEQQTEVASASPEVPSLRRSGRERYATTVKIGGYTVKVNNQYDLEEGEPSVFDSEFEHVKVVAERPEEVKKEKKVYVPKERVWSQEHKDRMALNREVDALHQGLEKRRHNWLHSHLNALSRWIPEKQLQKLQHTDATAPPADEPLEHQPASVNGTMREYQLEGASFMARMCADGVGCILADEMGLGKTIQSIALIARLKLELKQPGACLVVVPLSVLSSWMNELKKWCPTLKVARAHTSDANHHKVLAKQVLSVGPESPDVVLTTYDMIKNMHSITSLVHWRLLILDEGHLIKNECSLRSQALSRVRAASTVLLTGTPLQNNLHELWALLAFLNPVFSDPTPFEEAFSLGAVEHHADEAALQDAHKLLRIFCLRRTKSMVEVSLPPLIETRVECPLSRLQTFWYRRLMLKDTGLLSKVLWGRAGSTGSTCGWTGA
mmetsp:Transcript_20109/g.44013  ORF Transcript_20109/g.44013 Transcript_20109/m.44013 type:complete len:436 (+) Transcript_20109:112-1419(+)